MRQHHGLAAGADIIATNTFGANGVKLSVHPLEEIVAAAVRLAREAVEEAGRGWVALDVGPTGRLLRPMGDLPFEAAVEAYAREIRAGVQAGADMVFLETMSALYEAKAFGKGQHVLHIYQKPSAAGKKPVLIAAGQADCASLASLLEGQHPVIQAYDKVQALRCLSQYGPQLSLFLLDLGLFYPDGTPPRLGLHCGINCA